MFMLSRKIMMIHLIAEQTKIMQQIIHKNGRGVDTWQFARKTDLATVKSESDELN